MKTAVVILTYNAEKNNDWRKILQAYDRQDFKADLRLICDSSSTDNTCSIAEDFHWQIRSIRQADFNHGKMRQMLVDELDHMGFDTVILPEVCKEQMGEVPGIRLIGVRTVKDAVRFWQ
jgi:hypothetical protein